jgi:hypothetical protein
MSTNPPSHHINTLPEGTEVYYKGYYAVVSFVCEQYMSLCLHKYPGEPSRDVCILVYTDQYDQIELIHGNHSHES